jgi:hypothetical protein
LAAGKKYEKKLIKHYFQMTFYLYLLDASIAIVFGIKGKKYISFIEPIRKAVLLMQSMMDLSANN